MKKFDINDIVKYPEKTGFHDEIIGKIVGINTTTNFDLYNNPFIWIEILDIKLNRKSLVASHKLTLIKKGIK